jgi:hypothetical protein
MTPTNQEAPQHSPADPPSNRNNHRFRQSNVQVPSQSQYFQGQWNLRRVEGWGTIVITDEMNQSIKRSFEEKTRDRSMGVGTEHAMILLGELHKMKAFLICGNVRECPRAMPH